MRLLSEKNFSTLLYSVLLLLLFPNCLEGFSFPMLLLFGFGMTSGSSSNKISEVFNTGDSDPGEDEADNTLSTY